MIVSACQHEHFKKNGTTKSGDIRYRCTLCGKSWTEFTRAFDGMRVGMDLAVKIVSLLCEGVSVRATARLTGTKPQTVIDLCNLVGRRCEQYMASTIKDIHVDDVQVDEIWQFIYCKHYTAKTKKIVGGAGDSYCYTAVERNTKLLIAWHLGRRNEADTHQFCAKLNDATTGAYHLSSDGWQAYPFAVLRQIGKRVDYGQVIKTFKEPIKEDRRKYSPSQIIKAEKQWIMGNPDMDRVCTSHAERMNGSIRTFCKRMGRLTYCFSKRWGNHQAALGLFFAHYNYCRKHRSLGKITPAMAHGLTHEVWSVRRLIETVMAVG
ncbi:MAG TPA: hypothetical protein VMJ32_11435 [Pirellulales bacterium]|nr:hypothetical protein [Pirellulales bacterium]